MRRLGKLVFLLVLLSSIGSDGKLVNQTHRYFFAGGDYTTQLSNSASEVAGMLFVSQANAQTQPQWMGLPSMPTLPGDIRGLVTPPQAAGSSLDQEMVAFYGAFEFIQLPNRQLRTSSNLAIFLTGSSPNFNVAPCFPNGEVTSGTVAPKTNFMAFAGSFDGLITASGSVLALVDGLFLFNGTAYLQSLQSSTSSTPTPISTAIVSSICTPYFLPNIYPAFSRVQQVILSTNGDLLFAVMANSQLNTAASTNIFVSTLALQAWSPVPSVDGLLPSLLCQEYVVFPPLVFWNDTLIIAINRLASTPPICTKLDALLGIWAFNNDADTWTHLQLPEGFVVQQLLASGDELIVINATAVHAMGTDGTMTLLSTLTTSPNCSMVAASSDSDLVIGGALVDQLAVQNGKRQQSNRKQQSQSQNQTNFAGYNFATKKWRSIADPPDLVDTSDALAAVTAGGVLVWSYMNSEEAPSVAQMSMASSDPNNNNAWSMTSDELLDGGVITSMYFDPPTRSITFAGNFRLPNKASYSYNIAGCVFNGTGYPIGMMNFDDGIGSFGSSVYSLVRLTDDDEDIVFAGGYQLAGSSPLVTFEIGGDGGWMELLVSGAPWLSSANISCMLLVDNELLVIGGDDFFSTSSTTASNLIVLDLDPLVVNASLSPTSSFTVTALVTSPQGWLYAAGVDKTSKQSLVMRSKLWRTSSSGTSDWEQVVELKDGQVYTLCAAPYLDAATGGAIIYLGGNFQHLSSSLPVHSVAMIIDVGVGLPSYQTMGEGISGTVYTLAYVDAFSATEGPTILVGGGFLSAGGVQAPGIALWLINSQHWSAIYPAQIVNPEGSVFAVASGSIISAGQVSGGGGGNGKHRSYPLWLMLTVSGISLALVVAIVLLIVYLVRLRLAKNYRYAELDDLFDNIPDDGKPHISLANLLSDPLVKKIPWLELSLPPNAPMLGFGGSGTVRKGRWRKEDVAVKRLHVVDQAIDLDEFLREIKLLSSLDHPNILGFHGVAIPDDTNEDVVLITELMERGGLDRVIANNIVQRPVGVRLQLLLDSARGISYLHSCKPPIIHRDLKPQNILVNAGFHAKIADFGMSVFKSKVSRSMTANIGTPIYMAPELVNNTSGMYTETIDVYSWACIACEVMTGEEVYSQEQFKDVPVHALLFQIVHSNLRPLLPIEHPLVAQLIAECFQQPELRPSFLEISIRLERHVRSLEPPSKSKSSHDLSRSSSSSSSSVQKSRSRASSSAVEETPLLSINIDPEE